MFVWKCTIAVSLLMVLIVVFYTFGTEKSSSNTSIELNIVGSVLPKKRFKQHVPKFMLDLYHNSRNYNGIDVVKSVIPKSTGFIPGDNEEQYGNHHMLTFEVPRSSKNDIFLGAELKILTINYNNLHKNLDRCVKITIFENAGGSLLFLDKRKLHSKNNTWLTFNLTKPLEELLRKEQHASIKIVISFNGDFKLSLMPDVDNTEHDYPILLLSYNTSDTLKQFTHKKREYGDNLIRNTSSELTEDNEILYPQGSNRMVNGNYDGRNENTGFYKIRKTRSAFEDDYEEDTNIIWDDDNQRKNMGRKWKRLRNTCRRKPLYVDFSEIHFDTWIVQPSGYDAYQCHGKCFYPVAEHLSPTKHAIVQAIVHSISPTRAARSCCVPTKLDPISVLYIDSKGVLTYRYAYKDMVVSECGCR